MKTVHLLRSAPRVFLRREHDPRRLKTTKVKARDEIG